MRTIGGLRVDIAHDKSHCAFHSFDRRRCIRIAGLRVGDDAFKSENAEVAPARGEISIGNLAYAFKRHAFHYTNGDDLLPAITKELHSKDETVTGKMQERYS